MFDPSKYWEESLKVSENKNPVIKKLIIENDEADNTKIWTKLSMLSPAEQNNYISRIIQYWPIAMERRAFSWPHLSLAFGSCLTTSMIATKINGDFFLFSNKAKFGDVVRRAPKSPLIAGIYISGVTTYILNQVFIYKEILQENEICSSCIMTKCVGNGVLAGIVIPMISIPFLAHYVMLNKKDMKVPPVKNILDLAALSFEGVKSCRSIIPLVIGIQVISGIVGSYSLLWGRKRIFDTIDIDDEFVGSAISEAKKHIPFKEKLMNFFNKIPFIKDVIEIDNQRTKMK